MRLTVGVETGRVEIAEREKTVLEYSCTIQEIKLGLKL